MRWRERDQNVWQQLASEENDPESDIGEMTLGKYLDLHKELYPLCRIYLTPFFKMDVFAFVQAVRSHYVYCMPARGNCKTMLTSRLNKEINLLIMEVQNEN